MTTILAHEPPERRNQRFGGYLRISADLIDDQFGPGFARENPELVGALVRAIARDADTNAVVSEMVRALGYIGDSLSGNDPDNNLTDALFEIAGAIKSKRS